MMVSPRRPTDLQRRELNTSPARAGLSHLASSKLGVPPLSGEHRRPSAAVLSAKNADAEASAMRRSKATGGRVGSLRGARLLQPTPPGSLCSPTSPFRGGIMELAE